MAAAAALAARRRKSGPGDRRVDPHAGKLGLLELHDSAILRISDDLKVGAQTNGNGEVLIDGNAQISTGSGISIERVESQQRQDDRCRLGPGG